MEDLNKSIDLLIDELFTSEPVAKSMIKDNNPAKETADEAVSAAPKAEKDESRNAGRPKQISEIPQTDTDGKRSGEYDGTIAEKHEDGKKKEDSQVQPSSEMMKKSLSEAEYQEYQDLKKAMLEKQAAENLEKAKKEQNDLIKAAVNEAVSSIRAENDDLKKAFQEQSELIKAMANKPQQSRAVTNMAAVEKFQKSEASNTLSKAEVLDVAEELVKSGKLTVESVIELENNGFIFEEEPRQILEREVRRRYK